MLKLSYLFFFGLILSVYCSKLKEYQDEVPGHEGECKGTDQKFYKLGESMKDEPCVRKVCKGTAAPGSVYVEVERCTKATKESECELKAGAPKSYPDCCSQLKCKNK